MKKESDRPYHSPARQRQADETRRSIADAARHILLSKGFAGATIDAIARKAGVAPQTVYAVFGSKRGILAEILRSAAFGPRYQVLVRQALETSEPAARLRFAPRIARLIHDSERRELELLRGAGMVAPELAAIERERERERFEAQAPMISYLSETRSLRPGLGTRAARDILWALTGRELYRMLVVQQGWSSDRYEEWLAEFLSSALLTSAPKRRPGHPSGKRSRRLES